MCSYHYPSAASTLRHTAAIGHAHTTGLHITARSAE